jgi:2-(3-amino-3-carboxypropyl)histidine synthase
MEVTPVKKVTVKRANAQQIPDHIQNNEKLRDALTLLPSNYNFEIYKTLWRIEQATAKRVALQFPDGLHIFASVIASILECFGKCECLIMGDATYGACCVDDFTAASLNVDFLVHYGHSCLIPIKECSIPMIYVFVDIKIDTATFLATFRAHVPPESRVLLVSTIQFVSSLQASFAELKQDYPLIRIPQHKPLSPGEVLGCTAPHIPCGDGKESYDSLFYVGDGRFHLEAFMIANPTIPAFRFNPYTNAFTREYLDHALMLQMRKKAVDAGSKAKSFGIILGSLGRQGSPTVLACIEDRLKTLNLPYVVVIMSEIYPAKLQRFTQIDCWIQIACPRLSIDWGAQFAVPLLNPYEAEVALGKCQWQPVYPMDFYAKQGLGEWRAGNKEKFVSEGHAAVAVALTE